MTITNGVAHPAYRGAHSNLPTQPESAPCRT